MWNPNQDLHALVTDFTDHYYGPAAPAIREYLARLETATQAMTTPMPWNASPGQDRFLTPGLLAECQRFLPRGAFNFHLGRGWSRRRAAAFGTPLTYYSVIRKEIKNTT